MPSTLAQQLLPSGSQDVEDLRSIFECLGLTAATSSPYLFLKKVSDTLQHGIDIEFIPPEDHFGNTEISTEWSKWKGLIDLAIREYETQTDGQDYQNDTYSYTKRAKNKVVNALFYGPPDEHQSNASSSIEGMKLVLLAMLMLPGERKRHINIDKATRLFNTFIVRLGEFHGLNLDFSSNATIETSIVQCERLVEIQYRDSRKTQRQFLDSLKNTLRLLQGYHLGRPDRPNTPLEKIKTRSTKPACEREISTVRHTPFHAAPESVQNVGTFVEIVPEAGEESIIGLITPESQDDDDNAITEEVASAVSQFRSKYWLQNFNDATPWNSRGINPFTRSYLINWIKSKDTVVSLLFGFMLSFGRRLEDILNLEIGQDGDINQQGVYIRRYSPPDNRFTPSSDQEMIVETVSQVIHLQLPGLIRERFLARLKDTPASRTMGDLLDVSPEQLKQDTQKVVRQLIRNGATGLAIDRIHLSLGKRLAEITGDEAIGYMIAGGDSDMPPVSAYYVSYRHQDVEAIYRKAVLDLYL